MTACVRLAAVFDVIMSDIYIYLYMIYYTKGSLAPQIFMHISEAVIFMHILNAAICMHISVDVIFMNTLDSLLFMHILDFVIVFSLCYVQSLVCEMCSL